MTVWNFKSGIIIRVKLNLAMLLGIKKKKKKNTKLLAHWTAELLRTFKMPRIRNETTIHDKHLTSSRYIREIH